MSIPNPTLPTLGKKIAFSTLVQYGGKLIQIVLGSLGIKLIAHFLTEHDYALYAAITEYALFFSVAANLGIFAHMVRKIADAPHDAQLFFHALVLRVGTALGFFLLAIVCVLITTSDVVFLIGTVLFLSALLADYITSICDAFLQANYLMGRATLALLIGKVCYISTLYLFIRSFDGISGGSPVVVILALVIIASLLTAILSLFLVRQEIRWQWRVETQQLWQILRVSIPFGIISMINALYFRFLPDIFANTFLSDRGFAGFSISFHIAQVASLFSTFLVFSALPGFRQYLDGGHWHKAKDLYRKLSQLLLVTAILLVVGGTMSAEFLVSFLADKKYILTEFGFMLPMMFFLAAVSYGYDLVLITLFAFNQEKWFLKRELVALLIAGVVLATSFFFIEEDMKLLMIILSAIAAELYIVIVGYRKVGKVFAIKSKVQ